MPAACHLHPTSTLLPGNLALRRTLLFHKLYFFVSLFFVTIILLQGGLFIQNLGRGYGRIFSINKILDLHILFCRLNSLNPFTFVLLEVVISVKTGGRGVDEVQPSLVVYAKWKMCCTGFSTKCHFCRYLPFCTVSISCSAEFLASMTSCAGVLVRGMKE